MRVRNLSGDGDGISSSTPLSSLVTCGGTAVNPEKLIRRMVKNDKPDELSDFMDRWDLGVMAINLTSGAITMICSGGISEESGVRPIVQVIDLKNLTSKQQNNQERFRMLISDGVHYQQGMLTTQLNHLVVTGELQKGSIVQLSKYVSQTIQTKNIVIILGLDVILKECDIIGEPKQYVIDCFAANAPSPQARSSILGQTYVDQPAMATENPQSYSGGSPANNSRPPQTYGTSFTGNLNGTNMHTKAEIGSRVLGSTQFPGQLNDQNRNFGNPEYGGGARASSNTYGRPIQQPTYQQQPPMYINRGPVAKNEALFRIIPISHLNPYQGKWTIKARVTSKKDLRQYTNARGPGKVFSFELLDSEGGEIQVTCFNAVADQFFNEIEAGRVYLISKGMLKPASKNFSRLANDYEIYLENTSIVELCSKDDESIPRQQFHFRRISDIESLDNNSIIDVIGVVSSINLTTSITKKDGTETLKRTLQLKDMSGKSVEITLWGNLCNSEGQQLQNIRDSGVSPVLALKAGRVSDFNGKSVGSLATSQIIINPDIPEARELKEWFEMEGKNTPTVSLSRDNLGMGKTEMRKTVSQIKDELLGTSEKPDWISIKGAISYIKIDSFCYTACPLMVVDRQCNKKVANDGDGKWRCDRCDQSVEECDYRYVLQLQIQDHTGLSWVTAFQETGEEIMGISAKDLYLLKYEENDEDKFSEIVRKALCSQYLFKLKVKEETFNDERRVKSTISKAEKLDFVLESKFLLGLIENISTEEPNGFPGRVDSGINGNVANKQAAPSVNSMGNMANEGGYNGNHYTGVMGTPAAGTGVSLFCNSCGASGHNTKNCPSIMSRQGQPMGGSFSNTASYNGGGASYNSGGASYNGGNGTSYNGGGGDCSKCHQSGHWAKNCPALSRISSSGGGGGGSSSECFKCHQTGHWAKDCPGSNMGSASYGNDRNAVRYGGVPNRAGF
ncbi:hypothetical protein GIB67_011748 [Kingdonia uniflora]|uniref:Replication protein A subunit n=1 Tax=Kingdonia uniflora TaxID=39325 RepID=A0A7J7LUE4_9MAGN|nr:hypothetical protein GIB67_011748 [Kingdonia uniflora]